MRCPPDRLSDAPVPYDDLFPGETQPLGSHRSDAPLPGRGSLRKSSEAITWKLWQRLYSYPRLYRLFTLAATRLRMLTPPRLGAWTRYRSAPKPAARSLRELARKEGFSNE